MHESSTNRSWAERSAAAFTPNVAPAPLALVRGEGCHVFDAEGRRYLDAISGIAVSALGHAHPAVVAAISEQAGLLLHTSNLFVNPEAVRLAERLAVAGRFERIFFCNSGAEANEAAIKLARRYHFRRGNKDRSRILSFVGGFHGRTYGALAATPQPAYHEGFGPMPEGFFSVPYGDVGAVLSAVDERVAAVLVEPIQGEGGVNVPPPGFLEACRRIAHERGALLIADEVQTGFGRTGRMFAHHHDGVRPDIVCMAKGIAAGLPLGAIAARAEVAAAFTPGTHNTTYSGNPLACRVAQVVLDALEEPGFLSRVTELGERLLRELPDAGQGLFREVRGRGLLIGAELDPGHSGSALDLVAACRARGVLVHVAGSRVLRIAPPLVIGDQDIDQLLEGVRAAAAAVRAEPAQRSQARVG